MKIRVRDSGYGEKEALGYEETVWSRTATQAFTLLERWGLVAAIPDGEDSAGRQRLRLPTPQEVVGRAFDIAEEFDRVATARGHYVDLPDLNEINKDRDEKRAALASERRS